MGTLATAAPDLTDGLLALALAAVVSLLATPVAGALAWRIGAIDTPRERGLHQFPTPRLGGLAILVTVVAAGLVFLPHDRQTQGVLIGPPGIPPLGAADDILQLPPHLKPPRPLPAPALPGAGGLPGG